MPTVFQYAEKMMDEQLALNEIRQSSYDRKMETLKNALCNFRQAAQ